MPKKSIKVEVPEGLDQKSVQKNALTLYEKLMERCEQLEDPVEKTFYKERVRAYLKDFPNLNASSDLDDLHCLVMEMIIQKRLLDENKKTGRPFANEYNDSVKRASNIKESLAGRRVDRKKMPDKEDDITSVMERIFSIDNSTLEKKNKEFIDEEGEFMVEKKKRDLSLGLIRGKDEEHG